MDQKAFKLKIKSVGDDRSFEGFISTYGNIDEGKDKVLPGAFAKTITENGGVVPLLWQHDHTQPIGKLELEDSEKGLKVKGTFVEGVQKADEAYNLIKQGILRGMSIGYRAIKSKAVEGIRELIELKLWEGSLVTFPMNSEAIVTSVKEEEYFPWESKLSEFSAEVKDTLGVKVKNKYPPSPQMYF